MKIHTRDFDIVEIEEDVIYDFPLGIYGFENHTRFAIFEKTFDGISFFYLQSIQDTDPCFLVFDPVIFCPDYAPSMSDDDFAWFETDSLEDLIFLAIASVPFAVEGLSLNMKSPVVLNPKTKKARQIILQNSDYQVRYHPFLQNRKAGSSC